MVVKIEGMLYGSILLLSQTIICAFFIKQKRSLNFRP